MSSTEIDEALHQLEKHALTGERMGVIQVVSLAREYRALIRELLLKRYVDGSCDGAAIHNFKSKVEQVEEDIALADVVLDYDQD